MYLEAIMFSSIEYLRAIEKVDEFDYNSTLEERNLRYRNETYNYRTCLHKFKGYCDIFIAAHKLYNYPNGSVGGLGEVYFEAYQVHLHVVCYFGFFPYAFGNGGVTRHSPVGNILQLIFTEDTFPYANSNRR